MPTITDATATAILTRKIFYSKKDCKVEEEGSTHATMASSSFVIKHLRS